MWCELRDGARPPARTERIQPLWRTLPPHEKENASALTASLRQRVFTSSSQATQPRSFFARFGEHHKLGAAQSQITPFAIDDCSQNPALGTGVVDEKVETVSVGVAARRTHRAHRDCSQALLGMRA